MVFNPNIPQPTDLQSASQGALLNNNGFLQTWSDTDHYGLDDTTVNNGKHQVIQMPVQATQPVSVNDPMFYSFAQATGNAGILQYVVQAGGFVQSPITPIQSSAAGISLATNATANVFDFTSMPYCYGYINGMGISTGAGNPVLATSLIGFYWSGSKGYFVSGFVSNFGIFFSGNILQIKNISGATVNSIAWTLVFNRIFTPL